VVISEDGERLTVFFDEAGYKELLTKAVVGGHILAAARVSDHPGTASGQRHTIMVCPRVRWGG
jgi:hypothetical protein